MFLHLLISSLHGKSSSTGNLLEREDMALSVPDYGTQSRMAAQSAAALHGRQQRPYSVAVPGFSQVGCLQEQAHKHTHTHTHTSSHMTHELRRPTKPGKDLRLSVSESLDGAFLSVLRSLSCSTGIALTGTHSSHVPYACSTLWYISFT